MRLSQIFFKSREDRHSQPNEDIIKEVSSSSEKLLNSLEAQVNQFSHSLESATDEQELCSLNNDLQIVKVFRALEERIKYLETQVTQVYQLSQSLEERLKPIETRLNHPSEPPNNNNNEEDDYTRDNSGLSSELSDFSQRKIGEYKHKRVDLPQMYSAESRRLTLSITEESFGAKYKATTQTSEEEGSEEWSKKLFLEEDCQGIFLAVEEQNRDNYCLVLNQKRLTPKQFKTTFEFTVKHINQVFDYGEEFDKNKHTGIKIINPAIAVKKKVGGIELLELKVRGDLEFY